MFEKFVEIPTTPAQRDMWLLSQLNGHARRAYNESMKLNLEGALDRTALVQALRDVVARHEILRASFNVDGTALAIAPAVVFDVPYVDFKEMAGKEKTRRLSEWMRGEASTPFELERAPLLRAALARIDDGHHVLVLTLHHLIVDNWSNSVLIADLARLYNASKTGAASPVLPAKTFRDYVAWLAETARAPENAAAEKYWRSRFEKVLPVLELPQDRPRPPVQRFAGELARLEIDAPLLRDLTRAGRKHGATLFATLLAAFKCLLHRLSGQRDLVVGVLTAGQAVAKMQEVVGYCANLLPIRTQIEENPTFAQYLSTVRGELFGALTRPQVPFGQLLTMLDVPRDRSRPPLINVVFSLSRQSPEDARFVGLTTSLTGNHAGEAQYDLTVRITQNPDDLLMEVAYNSDIFDRETVERWLRHFRTMLAAIAADTHQRIGTLPWLSPEERYRILVEWNRGTVHERRPGYIHQAVAAQAARTPDAVAVCFQEEKLTYRELDERANQLAHWLRERDVGPEVLVGVSMDRSIELVVALLGILKAGGAYVPLDVGYPEERLRYLSDDARLRLRLTREDVQASRGRPLHAPEVPLHPTNAAYMIYTSGSTGNPKGAIVSHEAIYNRLSWMQSQYGLHPGEGVLQKTPSSFDVSVWEFFWPLMVGARLVVARPDGHKEPDYLAAVIAEHAITTIHFVPSMLQAFLGFPTAKSCAAYLRRVICSGETLGTELVRRFFQTLPGVALHNLYGPTEAAVDVTHWTCDPQSEGAAVPIGTPVDNTRIYLLDSELNPVPVGVRGELYIGGVQVGRGYHRRAAMTAERFIPDPFSPTRGQRMYRTGDLARYLPTGAVEYLGRADAQIKLRGHRIELGEIEAALLTLPEVRDAAVQLVGDRENARLVAYLELASALPNAASSARNALKEKLPSFMVPSAFVVVPRLPLTPNGKLDRRALSALDLDGGGKQEFEPPQTNVERALAVQWQELLKRKEIGRGDDFFRVGGHSLLAVQAVSRANATFGLGIPLGALFERPTLAGFSALIEGALAPSGRTVTERDGSGSNLDEGEL